MAKINKCANRSCAAVCRHDEGKFFRFDLDVGNTAGKFRSRTMYLWLCPRCARLLKPRVEVAGDTITLLLASARRPPSRPDPAAPSAWVN
jgi:hypothetical protein